MALDIDALYKKYGPMVLRRCRAILGDEQAAKDAMQDVFIRLLRNKERLDMGGPSSLLYQMATQVSLNSIRARKNHSDNGLIDRLADVADTEGQVFTRRMLDKVFGRLPASTRVMATMLLVDGFTLDETAREVGLSVSGVRKRMRGLKNHFNELATLVDGQSSEGEEK